jgi:hypothetical protein
MTTRASAARGTTKELFDGRVRKWVKEWTPVSDDRKKSETALKLLKWIQTGTLTGAPGVSAPVTASTLPAEEKTEQLSGPRHPRIKPVRACVSITSTESLPPPISRPRQRITLRCTPFRFCSSP